MEQLIAILVFGVLGAITIYGYTSSNRVAEKNRVE